MERADYIARVTMKLLEMGYPIDVATEGALTLARAGDFEAPEDDAHEYSIGYDASREADV
jgi:hypothetical protein